MSPEAAAHYAAYTARDPRFDGVFFVGVTSTGIYCRPVCTARTPRASNCRFFDSAAAAEKASFRPCLRCRPELAPGNAPVDDAHRIAQLLVQQLDEGALDGTASLEQIADRFGWSSRQIRRIVRRELGVSPIELVQTRRLLLAKQLLAETSLPMGEVASASGFSSLRRFNDAFSRRYSMPPSRFRKAVDGRGLTSAGRDEIRLQLVYRPPFDWAGMLDFLGGRAMAGVERADEGVYRRTVSLRGRSGWIDVRHLPDRRALLVELSSSLTSVLPALLGRLRNLFDLSARPDVICATLAQDERLAAAVERTPGLRIPGAFDGFEMAVRAILGQQISVRAATTLAGRFVQAFGEPLDTPHVGLDRLSPTAERVGALDPGEVAALGVVRTRARSIITLAREVASGRLLLEPGANPDQTMDKLVALPGIGPWTAHYIAMRALRWPDAFPKEDVVVRKALGGVTARQAEELSQRWRPWRAYATLHLWRG